MKRENKKKYIAFRVKPREDKYIRREADERGQHLSEYLRNMVLPSGVMLDDDGRIVLDTSVKQK